MCACMHACVCVHVCLWMFQNGSVADIYIWQKSVSLKNTLEKNSVSVNVLFLIIVSISHLISCAIITLAVKFD